MGLFDWSKKERVSLDEHATNPGDATSSPVAATLSAEAREQAERELATSTRRRGRPSKSALPSVSDQPALSPVISAEIARQLESCYDPKTWGALLGAPGDLMLVATGREHWKLSKDERDTLGACGSTAARTLMIQNPRALAFLMLGSALFSAYVPRMMIEIDARKKIAAEVKARKAAGEIT
jgi:hypothetical protein